jgi:hypothetical protein
MSLKKCGCDQLKISRKPACAYLKDIGEPMKKAGLSVKDPPAFQG